MRTSLIANISRKSLRFSGKSRVLHPNGHLITLVSNDASFMEWSAFLVHFVWVQPIIIIVGCILLLVVRPCLPSLDHRRRIADDAWTT
jgi:ATP-binding cassette subfamily C (CFTR/MRP) protein 1